MASILFTVVGYTTSTSTRILACIRKEAGEPQIFARLFWEAAGQTGSVDAPVFDAPPYLVALADVGGLPAGERVRYVLQLAASPDGFGSPAEALAAGPAQSFKLLPAEGTPLRIGLVTCNGVHTTPESSRYAMWTALKGCIDRDEIDLILYAGDQIYADPIWMRMDSGEKRGVDVANEADVADLAQQYRDWYVRTWQAPEIRGVLGSCPSIMMWDDHDIYDGWGSNDDDGEPSSQAFFAAAQRAFIDFQSSHGPALLSDKSAMAKAFIHGETGFLVLDARTNRSYPQQTVLGALQIDAVEAWLKQAPSNLRHLFVVVGVPFVHAQVGGYLAVLEASPWTIGVTDDLRDAWVAPNNRRECARILLSLFEAMQDRPELEVTVLAGDVHVASLGAIESRLPAHQRLGQPMVIHQVTSSGIGYTAPGGLLGWAISRATRNPVELGDPHLRGWLLDLAGVDNQVLLRRNFAILTLADPADPKKAEPHGNLSVRFHAEKRSGGDEELPQRLLGLRKPT